ncbi:GNAT family N-acetyltransferase [Parachitinimonas caeni]|uniref:GNAT family N-acetyltransferase n=1 Tax=Parachitinimonas caeni TaxID=3031301 RepID=A0ABT7E326_9NEIS|nr:GNAT family N-acetyltransferase [Parachitinimonas caeni]MDK2126726.1 GNAT family N-acetyltransferase [Parachitinimonas caeni]
MNAPLTIQILDVSHAQVYRQLMLQAYALHPDSFTSTAAERESLPLDWWRARLAPEAQAGERVIGAWVGGELVGVVGVSFERREKTRHKAALFGMYVDARFRQQGLGEKLVLAVIEAARQRGGVRLIQLTVSNGNIAAYRLYERCGFRPWGLEPYAVRQGDQFIDKMHMWRELDGA